jgi:TrmH family RNA methyltransferase
LTLSPLDPDRVDVVLVRPARAANVAAACRALKNMGLRWLRLVNPPGDLDAPANRALAYGAWDILDQAARVQSLAVAVAESALVIGTSGRPEPSAWSPRRLAEEGGARSGGGRTSIVFGPEASGLTREELALCHELVHIPSDPAHPSLNLAQAVLVVAYELRVVSHREGAPPERPPAASGELEQALSDFREAGLAIGYLNPENPAAILTEWRRWLARARPTPREVSLLRGLARQMAWAARGVARGRGGSG